MCLSWGYGEFGEGVWGFMCPYEEADTTVRALPARPTESVRVAGYTAHDDGITIGEDEEPVIVIEDPEEPIP